MKRSASCLCLYCSLCLCQNKGLRYCVDFPFFLYISDGKPSCLYFFSLETCRLEKRNCLRTKAAPVCYTILSSSERLSLVQDKGGAERAPSRQGENRGLPGTKRGLETLQSREQLGCTLFPVLCKGQDFAGRVQGSIWAGWA